MESRRLGGWPGLVMFLAFAACSGGGGGGAGLIGPGGGTVDGPSGARVVVPPGALATPTPIAVSESSSGGPALPAGVTALGAVFAFTPHGTHFAVPATITVPFDAASLPAGATPVLYKTDASRTGWEVVAGARVSGATLVGAVGGFSYAVAAVPTALFAPTEKSWEINQRDWHAAPLSLDGGTVGEPISVDEYFGPAPSVLPYSGSGRYYNAWVHSNDSGRTFWTEAAAPLPDAGSGAKWTWVQSRLTQTFFFEATQDSPSLSFLITGLFLEVIDQGGQEPGPAICPWIDDPPTPEQRQACAEIMTEADASFRLFASGLGEGDFTYDIGGEVFVQGQHDDWISDLRTIGAERMLWTHADFVFDPDLDGDSSFRHFRLKLAEPKTVALPIAHLHRGDVFLVEVTIQTQAKNAILGESFVGAYLRDPVESGALDLVTDGLKQIPPRSDIPRSLPPLTCDGGVDPAAGMLQFSAETFASPEGPTPGAVLIERTGGSSGPVSVRLQTLDGSALAGSDYQPVSTEVRFADGEVGPQRVEIRFLDDDMPEPNETLTVTLSEIGGCARLGPRSTATVTVLDDDQLPPPAPTYSVGGNVTGLLGTGLVLGDVYGAGRLTVAGDGTFTLPMPVVDGSPYDVRVETQPSSPTQECTVTHGAGQVAGANVTDVAVTCSSPLPGGGLDPGFGSDGRAVTSVSYAPGVTGARIGLALQADGRILLVGGLNLLRFNADGTLDQSFGTGGQVHVPFDASGADTAQDVAVQGDGKIVVVGFSGTGVQQDFALARFNPDGTVDTGFGTGGKTLTDFLGSTDRARRVLLQADGKILVAGFATFVASPGLASVGFALARYNPDGSLDTGFGVAGKVRDSVAGEYDLAQSLALDPDGRIVLAGSAANDGVSNPDVGLIRYWGDTGPRLPGWKDTTFGPLGTGLLQTDLQLATGWEEADDVAILADGTIALAGRVTVGATTGGREFAFVLGRCDKDGFGCQGLLTLFTAESDSARSMAVQADGKIVVVGQAGSLGSNPDWAIVRYSADGLGYDTSFGTDGKLTVDFFGGIDGAEAVVQQPDGKLVIGGFARSGGIAVLALARLNPS